MKLRSQHLTVGRRNLCQISTLARQSLHGQSNIPLGTDYLAGGLSLGMTRKGNGAGQTSRSSGSRIDGSADSDGVPAWLTDRLVLAESSLGGEFG
jgi:hypothetical protein